MTDWDDEQFQVFDNNGGCTLPIPRVVKKEEPKVVQIYTKTQDGYSSVIVADKDNIYLEKTIGTDEMTILMRGASYVKNMLPYRDKVQVFTGVPLYQIQMDRYLNRMRLPLEINPDNRKPELEAKCSKALSNLKLKLMQAFNKGERQ